MTSIDERNLEQRVASLERGLDAVRETLDRLSQRDNGDDRLSTGRSREPFANREPSRAVDPERRDVGAAARAKRAPIPPRPKAFPSPGWFAARSAEWWLGSLGVVFLVIALFLLYRYAVDHLWITPLVRVFTGIAVGAGMLGAATRFTSRAPETNPDALGLREILLGGGLAVWYVTSYAAAVYYQLISIPTARVCFLALSLVAGWLALKERHLLFALIAVGVGFAAPVVLPAAWQSLIGLALYLAPLGALGLMLYLMRGWESVLWITFVGFWIDLGGSNTGARWVTTGAALSISLLTVAFAAAFTRTPILRRRLVALGSDRYGTARRGAAAAFWMITIASPMLMLGILSVTWPDVATELWGIILIALAAGAYRLSGDEKEIDRKVRHVELTAAAIWSLAGLGWVAIGLVSGTGLATGPVILGVAAVHSALLMLLVGQKDFTAPRAIAKLTAAIALITVIGYELDAARAENLRWDWTIAEALVLGLSGWLWKLLSVDGKDKTHGRVYAIAGYAALLLVLARVLGTIWPPLVTASYAMAGAALLIASSKGEGRQLLLRLGGGTMVIVVARLIIVDMSSV